MRNMNDKNENTGQEIEEKNPNQAIGEIVKKSPNQAMGKVEGKNPNQAMGKVEGKNPNQAIGGPRYEAYWHSRGYLPHFESAEKIQHVTFHLGDSLPRSALEKMEAKLALLPPDQQTIERRQRIEALRDAGYGSCVLREPSIAQMTQSTLLFFDGQRYRILAWVVMPNHVHVLFQPLDGWTVAKIVASWKKFTARKICDYRSSASPSPSGLANLLIGNEENSIQEEVTLFSEPSNLLIGNESSKENAILEDATLFSGPANLLIGNRNSEGKENAIQENSGPRWEKPDPVWHREYWDRFIRNERHLHIAIEYIHQNPVKAGLVASAEEWLWSSAYPGSNRAIE